MNYLLFSIRPVHPQLAKKSFKSKKLTVRILTQNTPSSSRCAFQTKILPFNILLFVRNTKCYFCAAGSSNTWTKTSMQSGPEVVLSTNYLSISYFKCGRKSKHGFISFLSNFRKFETICRTSARALTEPITE